MGKGKGCGRSTWMKERTEGRSDEEMAQSFALETYFTPDVAIEGKEE
jgi:hypothetical protein